MANFLVTHKVETTNTNRYNPVSPEYGAAGDGVTDDTSAITNTITAMPAGGTLVLDDDFLISSTITAAKQVHVVGRGGLIVADGSNLVRALHLSAADSSVTGIYIDQSNVTGNTNDGIGLELGAATCSATDVRITGEGANGGATSNGVKITGNRCWLKGVHVLDPGYAGFRNDGDGTRLIGCSSYTTGRSDSARGFVDNSGNSTWVEIDDCHFYVSSTDAGSLGILFDVGTAQQQKHIVVRGTYVYTDNGNPAVKVANADKATFSDCHFEAGTFQIAEDLGELHFKDCYFDSVKINWGANSVDEMTLTGCRMEVSSSYCIEDMLCDRLVLHDCYMSGFTVVAIDNDHPWSSVEWVDIERCEFRGNSASAVYVWGDTGSGTLDTSGKLYYGFDRIVLANDGGGSIDTHANSDTRRFFRSLDKSCTVYRAGSAPTADTWAEGDRVYDGTPAAGGSIGWVCTTGGTPGTWKTFGDIAA